MALIGISKFEIEEYVSRLDTCRVLFPDDHPDAGKLDVPSSEAKGATIFLLGALDVEQRAFITDKTGVVQEGDGEGGNRLVHRIGSRNLWACRFSLKGWRNFKTEQGNEIKHETVTSILNGTDYKTLTNECAGALGIALVTELGEQILERNAFLESVRKNLSGPAQLSDSSPNTTA